MAHVMFVLKEKEKRTVGRGEGKREKSKWFTYRTARLTFWQSIHLGEDRGHAITMLLSMGHLKDPLGQFRGKASDGMTSVVQLQGSQGPKDFLIPLWEMAGQFTCGGA